MKDDGYSNYTVEETRVYCILDLHPLLPAVTSYENDDAYDQAEKCNGFMCGDPLRVDVEMELADWNKPVCERLLPYTEAEIVQEYLVLTSWDKF